MTKRLLILKINEEKKIKNRKRNLKKLFINEVN